MQEWRQKGPLGKLHNLVVYIRRSTQRIQRFQDQTQGLNLIRDNSTRWNSWFRMIDCYLEPRHREAIDVFTVRDKLTEDQLSEADWDNLQKIRDFLQCFEDATLATEGKAATLEKVLPTMDFLLEQFEEGKARYVNDRYMLPCCNSGWSKLRKYYEYTDQSPVYIAAIVLCPASKWEYFEKTWEHDQVITGEEEMKEFWEEKYKSNAIVNSTPTALASVKSGRENKFVAWQKKKAGIQMEVDEYTRYFQPPLLTEIKDSRSWWLEPTHSVSKRLFVEI